MIYVCRTDKCTYLIFLFLLKLQMQNSFLAILLGIWDILKRPFSLDKLILTFIKKLPYKLVKRCPETHGALN